MNTEQAYNRRWVFWVKFFFVLSVVVFLLLVAFFVFKVHSEGRITMREAKNIRMALVTADIELYPNGKCIFAPERANGLTSGVMDTVERLAGASDGVTLLSYDKKNREILLFTYRTDKYLVTYSYVNGEEHWMVDYLWKIFEY